MTSVSRRRRTIPRVVEGTTGGASSPLEWARANADRILSELTVDGAQLLKGVGLCDPADFSALTAALFHNGHDYVGGNSPRTRVTDRVFTSTEYAQAEKISLHNEASYLPHMPQRIMFYCQRPAARGGETVLADCGRVLDALPPEIVERFTAKGLRYLHTLHGGRGFGRSWQKTFQTEDRSVVERKLREDGYDFEWTRNGWLRTSIVAPAVASHPITGERVWINQADQWHPSHLDPGTRTALRELVGEANLPHNVRFGDDSPIAPADLDAIRAALAAEEVVVRCEHGDVLLCDNYLVAHGRQPFDGERQMFVSLE
jgi:alpha-ketoglutarate-dependent taurine dioxygenase